MCIPYNVLLVHRAIPIEVTYSYLIVLLYGWNVKVLVTPVPWHFNFFFLIKPNKLVGGWLEEVLQSFQVWHALVGGHEKFSIHFLQLAKILCIQLKLFSMEIILQ